ncbi:hypothetical protein [Bacillus thuringiensis]|uniref:hypothetical protein n=1 Tax=Bacillus thuringiensis TaxID=1428 RepID=UPI000211E24C|nr:hypothetical protein [Bacillus thuringiensis]
MNGNGKHDNWNHNQQISNVQMNHNHGRSYDCSCQQNQYGYEQQKQQYEQNNSQYMQNNLGNENRNGLYPYQENQYEQNKNYYASNNLTYNQSDLYNSNPQNMYKHQTYSNDFYCSPSYTAGENNILDLLGTESKQFQKISNINTKDLHRSITASNTQIGYQIDTRVPGPCKGVDYQNTVTYEQNSIGGDSQYLIFYKTDYTDAFIIANRANGRVLEVIPSSVNGFVTISNMFTYNQNQLFIRTKISNNDNSDDVPFSLTTENNQTLNICHHEFQYNTKITALDNAYRLDDKVLFKPTRDKINISFPNMVVNAKEKLPEPEELTNMDKNTLFIPKVIISKTLIPGIIVNDVTLLKEQQIAKSPYYVLEYVQSWEEVYNEIVPAYRPSYTWTSTDGIRHVNLLDIKNTINISIGGTSQGWGLRFSDKSDLFKNIITSAFIIKSTQAPDMGFSENDIDQYYGKNIDSRVKIYIKTHNLILRRLDQLNNSIATWTIFENTKPVIRTFPIS